MYEVFVDGAARGQGTDESDPRGHGAAAFLIFDNRKLVAQYARCLGRRTNNEAEYEAVIMALLVCWAANLKDPIIYSDSRLVVNQINRKWTCNTPGLRPLLLSVREIEDVYRFRILHEPRKFVGRADELANQILDQLLNGDHEEVH